MPERSQPTGNLLLRRRPTWLTHDAFNPKHAAAIKVIGVGGGSCNAVNRMIEAGLTGVDFYAVNSDVQALRNSLTENTVHIGNGMTRGLGAGANPTLGRRPQKNHAKDLGLVLDGADLVFITAGMGGGTGSGAAPIIAELARESGALTIAVVTKSFAFRRTQAHADGRARDCGARSQSRYAHHRFRTSVFSR